MNAAPAAFDPLASSYDREWTDSLAGRLQRDAVRERLVPLFGPGQAVLDFGCGTGEDAVWLMSRDVRVRAIDPSAEMVHRARAKGVDASVTPLEAVGGGFDGVLSNFSAVNCLPDLGALRIHLSRLVKPGGYSALCIFGKFCAWETLWYLLHADWNRATRRWGASSKSASLGIEVYYPSADGVARALGPEFELVSAAGIGLLVPPSYVTGLPGWVLETAGQIDRRLASAPLFRAVCDHRLLVFRRR